MEAYKKYLLVLLAFTVVHLNACSGSSSGGGNGNEVDNSSLNTDQSAFSTSLYPVLEANCAGCHSDNSDANIQLANFAHSDVVLAHAVIVNRDLINRDNPQLSRFVERLVDDKHFCWTSCDEDANTVINAIGRWNNLLASTVNDGGGGNEGGNQNTVSPQTSVQAFSQSLHPVVTQWCADCHDGITTNFTGFAAADAETAHENTLIRALIDFNNPANSELVTYLSEQEHNCWSDCLENAARMESAVVEWQQLLAAAGGGDGNNRAPIAVNDLYNTLSNVPVTTGNVLLNDSDADNDTLGISDYDARSARGGGVVNNLNGTFTYTSPSGFAGSDSFTYVITDGRGGSDQAVVTINVTQNIGPVATDDEVKVNQNASVVIQTLLDNDTSSSGNPLTIVSTDLLSQNGGRVQLGADNSITYTPPVDYTGIDRFIYTISGCS